MMGRDSSAEDATSYAPGSSAEQSSEGLFDYALSPFFVGLLLASM